MLIERGCPKRSPGFRPWTAFTLVDRPDTPAAGGTGPATFLQQSPRFGEGDAASRDITSTHSERCETRLSTTLGLAWGRAYNRSVTSRGVDDGHHRAGAVAFAEKFRPFRLTTVDGRTIDVEDDGAFMIGKSDMSYRAADGSFRWEWITYDQLESIEPLGQWKHWQVH